MSKRRNENGQMRREDWEAADDDERERDGSVDDGVVARASEDVIRARKILKPRARMGGATPSTAPAPSSGAANPFQGFQGLASAEPPKANPFTSFSGLTATTTPEPPKTNPFAGFSGLTAAPKPAAQQASAAVTVPTTYQEAIEVLNKEFLAFVNEQIKARPSSNWTVAVQDYLRHADTIGTKFASTKPVPANPPLSTAPSAASLTPPATSKPLFGVSSVSETKAPAPSAGSSTGFSSGTKTDASATSVPVSAPIKTSGFSFGATKAPVEAEKTTPAFTFGAKSASTAVSANGGFSFNKPATESEKPTPSFSFGAKPATTETTAATNVDFKPPTDADNKTVPSLFGSAAIPPPSASVGFSFMKPSEPAAPAPSGGFSFNLASKPPSATPAAPFSFGASSSSTASQPPASAGGTAEDDEDDENIGREEATVILKSDNPDDDCIFEADKSKIFEFKKDEKRWADKGTHPLKVLVNKTTKNARILVRNEIGKIVLNSALYKGLAVKPHEAKGKKTGVILALQVDDTMSQFLLKVAADKVEAFITTLENVTPK